VDRLPPADQFHPHQLRPLEPATHLLAGQQLTVVLQLLFRTLRHKQQT
jgi:hypothetical protein